MGKHLPVFSIISLIVLPRALALATVRDLFALYAALPPSTFVTPLLFGAGWGVAQVLFGLSIARLGAALGYAVVIGLGALLGTVVPLVIHPEIAGSSRGVSIFFGIVVSFWERRRPTWQDAYASNGAHAIRAERWGCDSLRRSCPDA